jgi:hypothetical protein
MASKAVSTKGLQLQRGDGGGPETFTKIGEVTSIKGPSESMPTIDVSSFDSTAMEFLVGIPDAGSIDYEFNYVGPDAQQAAAHADMVAGTKRNFKVVASDMPVGGSNATSISFAGYFVKHEFSGGGVNQALKGSGSIKISGPVTYVRAA